MTRDAALVLPSIVALTTREQGRAVLRSAFSRRRTRLQIVRSVAAAQQALRTTLVDAVIVDLVKAGDEPWELMAWARQLPSIPFFAWVAPRVADAPLISRSAEWEAADVFIDGIDDEAMRELVIPLTFTSRFAASLTGAHAALGLAAPLQQRAWQCMVSAGGRPVRTEQMARTLGVTREHLSRAFAAAGAPNLKRVIDLVRLISAAELAKNPGYDLADVGTILSFASPSHLATTAQRVAGIRAASLTRLRPQDLLSRFGQGRFRSRD